MGGESLNSVTPRNKNCQEGTELPTLTEASMGKSLQEGNQDTETIAKHYRTSEGYSEFSENSNLGNQVATLPTGQLFGELALQNNAPRAATIKCLEDTEFMILGGEDFHSLMSRSFNMMAYFNECVPGVKDLKYSSL